MKQVKLLFYFFVDTHVDPALLENLGKLERQKIADSLNERLLSRPGPIELIQDRILPVDSPIQNAIEYGSVLFEQTVSPTSSTTDAPSLSELENGLTTLNCTSPSPPPHQDPFSNNNMFKTSVHRTSSAITTANSTEHFDRIIRSISNDSSVSPTHSSSQISLSQKENEKLVRMINKKTRPTKPKVKKLKFHECRPPDMPAPSNASNEVDERYQRLLEQQTLYLRLQVMQQNAMLNALQGNTESMDAVTEEIENVVDKERGNGAEITLVKSIEGKKLDDLKVIDLRAQLKQRGLLVSGSKAKLIERLTAFEEGKATAADFSYLVNNSISKNAQKLLPPSAPVDMTPASTVMQVTTYATNAGQTYQVVQAVPQSPQNLMQYQVLPANCLTNQTMPQIQLGHVNIQPVVNISQPNVMTIHETVAGVSQKTQIQPSLPSSQMQFQFSPPPQQPSPAIVLQPSPDLQNASLVHHEKRKIQVTHMPVLSQGLVCQSGVTYMTNQNQSEITQLSQSMPSALQFPGNYNIITTTRNDISHGHHPHQSYGGLNDGNISLIDELSQDLRGRAASEPSNSLFKPQGHRSLTGLNTSNSNTKPNPLVRNASPTVDQMRANGNQLNLSHVGFERSFSNKVNVISFVLFCFYPCQSVVVESMHYRQS